MITLFEDFNNDIDIDDFIYVDENDVTKIPSFSFKNFSEWFVKNLNTDYFVPMQYNSLMRFYLYIKLLRYKGNDTVILKYIKGLKDKDLSKSEIIRKIPNNKIVLNTINTKFGLNIPNYEYDKEEVLQNFIDNIGDILSDENLKEYINIVSGVTEKSKESEKVVKGVIAMIYGKWYDILKAEESEDLDGVDVWMINKESGSRQSIQVKNITGNVTLKVQGDYIYINNSSLDLKDYNAWNKDELHYDYLGFYLENDKKVCLIKAWCIYRIEDDGRTIRIKLKNGTTDNKYDFKMIDIPPKLLPKDYSKIFINNDVKAPARLKKKTP
jgi:hypothetical protein